MVVGKETKQRLINYSPSNNRLCLIAHRNGRGTSQNIIIQHRKLCEALNCKTEQRAGFHLSDRQGKQEAAMLTKINRNVLSHIRTRGKLLRLCDRAREQDMLHYHAAPCCSRRAVQPLENLSAISPLQSLPAHQALAGPNPAPPTLTRHPSNPGLMIPSRCHHGNKYISK